MHHPYQSIDRETFVDMTSDEQSAYFGENGFLVVPGAVAAEQLQNIHREIEEQGWQSREQNIWTAPSVARLVENPKALAAMRACYGDDVRLTKAIYVENFPIEPAEGRSRRQHLHLDYSTNEGPDDFRNFYPSWVNVGFYLTDLTPESGPLWVVPGSNHAYRLVPGTSLEHLDGEACMVLAEAGDAILFHCFTAHAGGFSFNGQNRRGVFLSYRPGWTRAIGPVSDWPSTLLEDASEERKNVLAPAS